MQTLLVLRVRLLFQLDGTADQVLSTDGSGTLSFATASGGGGGQPTYASINRVVSQTGGNNVVDDTKVLIDYSAHSGSGNKRFRGKWLNVSGYLKIMYYLGPTSNIVSCHLSGVLDENHTYDNTEPRNRIEDILTHLTIVRILSR